MDGSGIINWVKSNQRFSQSSLSPFETGSMHQTTFNDLSIRLVMRTRRAAPRRAAPRRAAPCPLLTARGGGWVAAA
jgi:hypothetical protein